MTGTFPHNVSLGSIPFFWDFRLQPWRGLEVQTKERPELRLNAHNWEVNYFWPIASEGIIIPAFEDEMYHADAYNYKIYEDVYLLNFDPARILKVRKRELQIKEQIATVDDIGAFAKKERHPLPSSIADEYFKTNETCFILKEALRIKLKSFPHTKLEFAKLHLPNSKTFSFRIEGKEFEEVATINSCLKLNVPPQTYAEFIQQLNIQKNSNSGL